MQTNVPLAWFEQGAITPPGPRGKPVRPDAEQLIPEGNKGGLHRQRQVVTTLHDQSIGHELFANIAPKYQDRNGGYTRILKLGPRPGDQAPMARIELV